MASGLLNKANIILTPTGYKAGKLFNIAPVEEPFDEFNFARTSTATRINSSGLISNVATGVPRISYDSNGENGHWLLEPTSTNLVSYSEDFTQWTKEATVTLTSNFGISPDGTQNSTRMQMNEDDSIFISSSSGLMASFFVKGTIGETIRLSNGSATTHTLTGDWDRVEAFDSSSVSSFISINTYSGATARDIEIWGAQAEALSFATSYIPTNGSTVTRDAETATGAGSSDLINSTEGVLYAEIAALVDDNSAREITLSDGTANNRIELRYGAASNRIQLVARSGGVVQASLTNSTNNILNFNKVAVKYKANDFALWINGVEQGTDTSGITPVGLNELQFNEGDGAGGEFYGKCKAVAVFNEALSDSELTQLTT